MTLHEGIILQNYIQESYYGIILRNYIMEFDNTIIFMKRIPGMPGESTEPPVTSRDPMGTPLEYPGTPWTPRGPPGDLHGPQKQIYLNKFPAPEAVDCCIQIPSLQRIILRTPLDRFIMYITRTKLFWSATGPSWGVECF